MSHYWLCSSEIHRNLIYPWSPTQGYSDSFLWFTRSKRTNEPILSQNTLLNIYSPVLFSIIKLTSISRDNRFDIYLNVLLFINPFVLYSSIVIRPPGLCLTQFRAFPVSRFERSPWEFTEGASTLFLLDQQFCYCSKTFCDGISSKNGFYSFLNLMTFFYKLIHIFVEIKRIGKNEIHWLICNLFVCLF